MLKLLILSNWKSQWKALVKVVKHTGKTCTSGVKMFLAFSDLNTPKSGPPSIRSPYWGQELSNFTPLKTLNHRNIEIFF